MRPVLWELALHQLEPVALEGRPQKKVVVPLKFHSTSPPKRALLWVLTVSFLVAARLASTAGLVVVQASRQARCGDGERGHGH